MLGFMKERLEQSRQWECEMESRKKKLAEAEREIEFI